MEIDAGVEKDAGVTADAGSEDAGVEDAGVDGGIGCATSCDDSNPCTTDSCVGSICQHDPLDGTSCDDSDACTTADVCRVGVCTGESPVQCPAPGRCEVQGVCQPATGQCSRPFSPMGTSCDDGSLTTSSDTCNGAGGCAGSPIVCPTDTACITFAPDGTATCVRTIHTTATCDDGNLTTGGDRCDMSGACVGTPIFCPPDTAFITSAPDGTSCVSTVHAGDSCDDSDLTTSDDRCKATGLCAGTPVTCPANDTCSTWTPNGTATCSVTRHDGAACEDSNACTPTGTCNGGTCVVPPAVTCSNGGTCVAGGCSCTSGWTGATCATDVDECAAGACGGGSTCMNSPGSYGCQCVTNYTSTTGANCTSTARAMELVVFYDEGAARRYGPDAEARLASIIARTKALFDNGLSSPSLTVSLNAVIRFAPFPSAVLKRSCDTTVPGQTCVGCYSDSACNNLLSNSASEIDTDRFLDTFRQYANVTRRTAVNTVSGGFDVALLITDADFASSVIGLAGVGVACAPSLGAGVISLAQAPDDQTIAVTIAHELGHTLGMTHDATGSFIMSASTMVSATSFSAASLTAYRSWIGSQGACLATGAPDSWGMHSCGNGVIDGVETCDPNIVSDSCCSATCQLNPGCSCGNTEPCCANGVPRDAGTVCAASRGECDVADTCDGQTGACSDRYSPPRTACSNGGSCLRGTCASRTVQCRTTVSGPPYDTWTGCNTSTRCDQVD